MATGAWALLNPNNKCLNAQCPILAGNASMPLLLPKNYLSLLQQPC